MFRKKTRKYILTVILGAIVIVLGWYSFNIGGTRNKLNYKDSLNEIAVTVNGEDITLEDMVFYVVYEEHEVELQAQVYNPENTNKYWNVHTDGEFIRVAARNAAMQMAIHDEIFYQMAQHEGIELTDEEIKYTMNTLDDFWSDLSEFDQRINLTIEKSVYEKALLKVALAQKYQEIYSQLQGESMAEFDFCGDKYKKLLEENSYDINTSIWKRVDVGNVSLRH